MKNLLRNSFLVAATIFAARPAAASSSASASPWPCLAGGFSACATPTSSTNSLLAALAPYNSTGENLVTSTGAIGSESVGSPGSDVFLSSINSLGGPQQPTNVPGTKPSFETCSNAPVPNLGGGCRCPRACGDGVDGHGVACDGCARAPAALEAVLATPQSVIARPGGPMRSPGIAPALRASR